MKILLPLVLVTAATAASVVLVPPYEASERLPGGQTTIFDQGQNAFSLPLANLTDRQRTDFVIGNSFFKKNWVEAPASTTARDGLGPHFIARSCGACHTQDGRGAPPSFENNLQGEQPMALLFRLSVPGQDAHGGPKPEPVYGGQFNNDAVSDVKPEGQVAIHYTEVTNQFADGEPYTLLKPTYQFTDLGYGPMRPDTMVSPRIAPQMIGLGLLEAIKPADILANAKAQAAAGGTIKGRPNYVWDAYARQKLIGRYGWKANTASVAHQSAGAFIGDIGITSKRNPHEECTAAQTDCLKAPSGGKPEISEDLLNKVIFYSRTLAVPAARDQSTASVQRGRTVFYEAQCATCHVPKYVTGNFKSLPQLGGQTIYPYTDLLLHDMGEGLSDGRPDFAAGGRDWKTPALWGLGLVKAVNRHTRYLHDGRARNLMEAILWHGGEAEGAQQYVLKLSKEDRENLVAFLQTL
ncbi:di-heme oxidoreductase family protein [Chitinimonas sp. BJB300]|uniref:di-heme oxidoreductase family protein n=1 Tax=Chitinimonas sp. BJB300 TaxID=1559339 RepID=UPI000C0DFD05|nr:di-heme oxidoredictase family protein [Chitinimonas sp. BJB300]PHV12818.1 thiol oxidoreductase [Chitinimonas sp. BJB300]TSJ88057.1 c-type cytochrome [Chitinimonas sp. BJB300]